VTPCFLLDGYQCLEHPSSSILGITVLSSLKMNAVGYSETFVPVQPNFTAPHPTRLQKTQPLQPRALTLNTSSVTPSVKCCMRIGAV
jgi:hypothetical protein